MATAGGAPSPRPLSADSSVKLRRERVRTGCLKCRVRRRKCDERKPRCQRCIDGDFECRWPSGVTFLDKNALTIDLPRDTIDKQNTKYSRLQFLGPSSWKSRKQRKRTASVQRVTSHEGSPIGGEDLDGFQEWPTSSSEEPYVYDQQEWSFHDSGMDSGSMSQDPLPLPSWSPLATTAVAAEAIVSQENMATTDVPMTGTTPSDGYETALQALLSLGGEGASSPNNGTGKRASAPAVMTSPGIAEEPSNLQYEVEGTAQTNDVDISKERLMVDKLSTQDILDLLKHYRYHVAPWLDICDSAQTFGSRFIRLAVESDDTFAELLTLSAASLQQKSRAETDETKDISMFLALEAASDGALATVVATALRQVRNLITSSPEKWASLSSKLETDVLNDWKLESNLRQRLSCLLLRLEISAALVDKTTLNIRFHTLVLDSSPYNDLAVTADGIFQYASRPSLLCARVLRFCSDERSPETSEMSTITPPALRWCELAEDLSIWYGSRPQEFQPMVEIEADIEKGDYEQPRQQFPIVLFSSGAALFATQLYHTAMLLLLQNKPRTLALEHRLLPKMSPLWHAQRICGIAFNNDRLESWDLTLVASLYVAARGMTYEPQQRQILATLHRVAETTGWNIGHFETMLQREWDLDDNG